MEPALGKGIYTITDVARILNIPKIRVRYWFAKYVSGEFESKQGTTYFYDSENIAVNFYTLIETFVFFHLKEKGTKTKNIIQAHNILAKHYKTPYPFALYKFLSSGKDLFHDFETENLFSLDGTKQLAIRDVINHYSENIHFGEVYAEKYYPNGNDKLIVVNPNNQFGAPIIDGTNIKASTIMSLVKGGESIDVICSMYKIKTEQVNTVIQFMSAA